MSDFENMSDEEFEAELLRVKSGESVTTEPQADEPVGSVDEEVEQPTEDNSEEEPKEDSTTDEKVKDDEEDSTDEDGDDSDDSETTEEDSASNQDDSSSEESNEQPTASIDDELKSKKWKVKAKGTELEVGIEDLLAAYPRVVDYTQKMQAIAEYRRKNEMLAQNGITDEDLSILIDAKKGDKAAIAKLIKQAEVDPMDIDVEELDYKPKDYGVDPKIFELKDIEERIKDDPEYPTTYNIVTQEWDEASRRKFSEEPSLIEQLHIDVKNGTYAKVAPEALKLKIQDGGRMSDMDYYIAAGQAILQAEQSQTEPPAQTTAPVKAKKRAAAAPATKKSVEAPPVDVMELSDEEFDKMLEQMRGY